MSIASVGNVADKRYSEVPGVLGLIVSIVVLLALATGVGLIPSWAITSVTSWIGSLKYEEVWMNVAPWTWPIFGIIAAIVLFYLAIFYATVIIPIKAAQYSLDDGYGSGNNPDWRYATDGQKWNERYR